MDIGVDHFARLVKSKDWESLPEVSLARPGFRLVRHGETKSSAVASDIALTEWPTWDSGRLRKYFQEFGDLDYPCPPVSVPLRLAAVVDYQHAVFRSADLANWPTQRLAFFVLEHDNFVDAARGWAGEGSWLVCALEGSGLPAWMRQAPALLFDREESGIAMVHRLHPVGVMCPGAYVVDQPAVEPSRRETFWKAADKLACRPGNRIGGYPEPMESDLFAVCNWHRCGRKGAGVDWKHETGDDDGNNNYSRDWILLLQLPASQLMASGESSWSGDCSLHWWIHREDLAAARWERSVLTKTT